MLRKNLARATLVLIGGALVATGTARAADRTDAYDGRPASIVYRDVGQGRIIIAADDFRRPDEPYQLTGRQRKDNWERQGHWIEAGQAKVFIPPTPTR